MKIYIEQLLQPESPIVTVCAYAQTAPITAPRLSKC